MRPRLFSSCLLTPEQLAPSQDDMRVVGAFNPGAVTTEQGVVLVIRVAEAPRQIRRVSWVCRAGIWRQEK